MNEGLTRKEDLHEGQEELRGEEREAVLPAGTAGGLQPDRLPQSGRRILGVAGTAWLYINQEGRLRRYGRNVSRTL